MAVRHGVWAAIGLVLVGTAALVTLPADAGFFVLAPLFWAPLVLGVALPGISLVQSWRRHRSLDARALPMLFAVPVGMLLAYAVSQGQGSIQFDEAAFVLPWSAGVGVTLWWVARSRRPDLFDFTIGSCVAAACALSLLAAADQPWPVTLVGLWVFAGLVATLFLDMAPRDRLWLLLPASLLGLTGNYPLPAPLDGLVAPLAVAAFAVATVMRIGTLRGGLWSQLPASTDRPRVALWYGGAMIAAVVSAAVITLLLASSQDGGEASWRPGLALMILGGAAITFGLSRADPVRGHAVAIYGAALACLAGYAASEAAWWVTWAGFLLPWAALAVAVHPAARVSMVPLQYLGLVPFFEALQASTIATNLMLGLGAVHLLAVWASLPLEGRWRGGLLAGGALATAAMLLVALVALSNEATTGRQLLAGICLAFLALLAALWRGPLRGVRLPAYQLPHAGAGAPA